MTWFSASFRFWLGSILRVPPNNNKICVKKINQRDPFKHVLRVFPGALEPEVQKSCPLGPKGPRGLHRADR